LPRSETISTALAERFAGVRRAESNADVAETADIVVLGMRPAQLEDALAGVDFRPGQIVVSLVAGFSLEELRRRWPEVRACRVVPLPGIARGIGPMTMCPAIPEVEALLEPIGDLFVVADETQLNVGGLSCFMSTYFELQARLVAIAAQSGIGEAEARRYTTSLLSMLVDTARRTPEAHFGELVAEHQTKGGLNERVRDRLLAAGWFDVPATVMDDITTVSWKSLG
jgi:pyrroline-5-carboxylate reductase